MGDELQRRLASKHLIFTVTTGRSGTGYLARTLHCLPGVDAFHEPKPRFHAVAREALQNPQCAKDFWIRQKLPAIAQLKNSVYIETSHLFCKGFLEPMLELDLVPDAILLSRPHRQVAESLYGLGTIPGRTDNGLRYCLSPNDPNVLAVGDWQQLHDYQLCYWYCLEIERRQREYAQLLAERGAKIVATTLEEVGTREGFTALTETLGLPKLGLLGSIRYRYASKHRVNTKQQKKTGALSATELDELEQNLLSCIVS